MGQQTKKPIGAISKKLYFRIAIGDGVTDSGKEFEIAVSAGRNEPLVLYGGKVFKLTWKDIVTLAEQAGLFEEEQ